MTGTAGDNAANEIDDWQSRLAHVLETMREMSSHSDPAEMVQAYATRMEKVIPRDRLVTLSRRGHEPPEVRVTRDSQQREPINPWKQRQKLPVIRGGLLADLIYADAPRIIDDLQISEQDPGAPYLAGNRSLMAIPLFDQGVALNMVLFLRAAPHAFDPEQLPELVWVSNLFGRATQNLVLSAELRDAYHEVDQELQAVADIQRSLLPAEVPRIPTMELAVHYQTSRRAGGDYYDFYPLPDGRWGILVADVSGHGTPAAVLMAVTHSLAHTHPDRPDPPGTFLTRLNRGLTEHYTSRSGRFVTAFYGVYNPETRELVFASAGHMPPRVKRCGDGSVSLLRCDAGLPLGLLPDERYAEALHVLRPGDRIVFFTDGITEAFSPQGEMFGADRLDDVLGDCGATASELVDAVLTAVDAFSAGRPADDDRTLVIARIT
jgi:sigma-B regulation protein RsbU (phosphoserine phosphatase)